ncbi:MAG: hypothetical protein EAZ52_08330, partial [Alphaproteobacteria bacterium]
MKQLLLATDIKLDCIGKSSLPPIPPWLLQPPEFIFNVHNFGPKSETSPDLFKSSLNELLEGFNGFDRIYTDGSKSGAAVAAAAIT